MIVEDSVMLYVIFVMLFLELITKISLFVTFVLVCYRTGWFKKIVDTIKKRDKEKEAKKK